MASGGLQLGGYGSVHGAAVVAGSWEAERRAAWGRGSMTLLVKPQESRWLILADFVVLLCSFGARDVTQKCPRNVVKGALLSAYLDDAC